MSPIDSGCNNDLARRIERAAGAAWPAIEEWTYDGWILRFARGYTKRINSITPIEPGARPVAEKIAACEAAFAARLVPIVFRLPSMFDIAAIEAALATRSYRKIEKTSVRAMPLDGALPVLDASIEIEPVATESWLGASMAWNRLDAARGATLAAILGRILAPKAFALARSGSEPAALGLGVHQEALACLTAIIADPTQRRRGFGRAITTALLHWARARGAQLAYLQVVKTNASALRLYNALGFDREIYRYHYLAKPETAVSRDGAGIPSATSQSH